MSDGNRNNWSNWLGLAAGAALGAGAAYLAYNATQPHNRGGGAGPGPGGVVRVARESESEESRARAITNATPDLPNYSNPGPRSNRVYLTEIDGSERSVREKHRAAAPYYFFLSSANDLGNTHSEPLSLRFADILDTSLGELESSLQITFTVDMNWLVNQYKIANQDGKPITLIYDKMKEEKKNEFVTPINVKAPKSNHTKMCVLAYKDGSMRVCVHTANLTKISWNDYVQGIWLSPLCPALPVHAVTYNTGDSETHFKEDLIQYLSAYSEPQLQPWIGKLRGADFSNINVFFVASTPSSNSDMNRDKWGLAKMAKLLRQHVQIKPKRGYSPSSWQIIAQCSSIGSLGPDPTTSWLCNEFQQTMSEGQGLNWESPSPVKLVYPSSKNANSCDGRRGGSCLAYSQSTHDVQPWVQGYLFGWKCDTRDRTRIMPHMKTYTRVSPDHSELAWFLLTSANLSKAAWGQTETGAIGNSHYEAGVLFLPKILVGSSSFPIKEGIAGCIPVFPMPYDLPLTQYSPTDVPYFIDGTFGHQE